LSSSSKKIIFQDFRLLKKSEKNLTKKIRFSFFFHCHDVGRSFFFFASLGLIQVLILLTHEDATVSEEEREKSKEK